MIGCKKDKNQLDHGTAGCIEHFWHEVVHVFQQEDVFGYDTLAVVDPMLVGINASHMEKHSWEKHCEIFMDLQSKYAKCIENNKQLSTHVNFKDFCNNRPDCCYLHLWLCEK